MYYQEDNELYEEKRLAQETFKKKEATDAEWELYCMDHVIVVQEGENGMVCKPCGSNAIDKETKSEITRSSEYSKVGNVINGSGLRSMR